MAGAGKRAHLLLAAFYSQSGTTKRTRVQKKQRQTLNPNPPLRQSKKKNSAKVSMTYISPEFLLRR